MKRYQQIILMFVSVLIRVVPSALAQTNPNLETGLKPYGSYDDSPIDSVSITNGNLNLHIPLFDYPQRGRLSAPVLLAYNNKNWVVQFICSQTSCIANWAWSGNYPGGLTGIGPEATNLGMLWLNVNMGNVGTIQGVWNGPGGTKVTNFTGVTEDGGRHQFVGTSLGDWRSIDGTGIHFSDPDGVIPYYNGDYVLLDRTGNGYNSSTATTQYWRDTNGNYFSEGNTGLINDTLGRQFKTSTNDGTGTTGCSTASGLLPIAGAGVFTFPGPNGGTRMVKVCSAMLQLQTNFGAHVIDPITQLRISVAETSFSMSVAQSIIVNDGTSWSTSPQWTFQYNNGVNTGTNYGDLTQVTLPTGGTVTYTWGGTSLCSHASTNESRGVTSRTINANDGTGNQTTTYAGGKVTDPAGNDAVHTFTTLNGSCSYYDSEVDYYKGSSTATNPVLLKIVQTAYSWTSNPLDQYGDGGTTAANVVPISVTTKWPIPNTANFLVSQVQTDYDNSFTFGGVGGGTFGRVTEKREYDYGLNSPGPLLRKTDYTYAAVSGSSYLTANLLDLVTQKTVYNGGGSKVQQINYSYDAGALQSSGVTEQHTTSTGVRGNLTLVQEWLNTTGGLVTTRQTSYYDTGMPYQTTDLRNNLTSYTYDPANYGAYLTQTQYPNTGSPAVTHKISGGYDFNTGQLTSFTDQNSQISNYVYDQLGRVTSASYPDGGSVGLSYTDTVPWQIQKTLSATSTLNKVTNAVFDGLGRLNQAQSHDPDCQVGSQLIKVDYTYGYDLTQNTHYGTVTTPYCNTPGAVFGLPSRTDSDTLGRAIKVTQTDGTLVSSSYVANSVGLTSTSTDEAGITRTNQTDGLGRLTTVWEDPNSKNYETDYAYDTLNNMTSVTQKGDNSGNRSRNFYYDSLSRLTSASNPESGTISYTYSNSPTGACASSPDIVCTKTAPAANQTGTGTATTTYTYDALDRLTGKTYAGVTTPSVYYGYDHDTSTLSSCATTPPSLTDSYPISERTAMCDASGGTSWSHDKMGRVLIEDRTINSVTHPTTYTYNLDGSLSTLKYPYTAKTITYTLNSSGSYTAGRPVSAKDGSGILYVTNATYAPQGALASLTNGGVIFGAFSYNSRMQPLQIFYGTNTPPSLTGSSCPSTQGNIMHRLYKFGLGTNDNGDVYTIVNCRDATRTENITYDTLNRIANAHTTASTWGEVYTIDPWSNLTNIAPYNGWWTSETLNCSTANTKNQLNTCYSYDAAGNLTQSGSTTYTYDAENRLTAVSSPAWYYVYDGDGNRVEKCTATPCPSTGTGTLYWRDLGGDPITESGLHGTTNYEYIFFNGKRVARRDAATNVVHYYFSDHLGTHAVVENATGTQCEQDIDYYPYGGAEHDYCTTPVAQNYKFNGKERDTESGLDEFGARYYGSSFGRFMTPDWAAKAIAVPYANFGNPQSLNLYSYVENNPTTTGDPDGHQSQSPGGPEGTPGSAQNNALCYNNPNNCHSGPNPGEAAQNQADPTAPPAPPTPDPAGVRTDPALNPNSSTSSTTSSPADQTQAPMESRGQGGKGERGQTSKPDNPTKGAKPVRDKDGKIVGWQIPSPDGKGVRKPLGWGTANGLNPKDFDTAKKMGIIGAVGAAGAYVIATFPEWGPVAGALAF